MGNSAVQWGALTATRQNCWIVPLKQNIHKSTQWNLHSAQRCWRNAALCCIHACTIGVISSSGGNFENLIDKLFLFRFPCYATLTINMWPKKIIKIPTTTINHPYYACEGITHFAVTLSPRCLSVYNACNMQQRHPHSRRTTDCRSEPD